MRTQCSQKLVINTHTQGDKIMTNPYELRYDIYQQARQVAMDKFYNDYEVWNNWQFDEQAKGKCPIKERPKFPEHEEVLVEAEKIYSFVQQKETKE